MPIKTDELRTQPLGPMPTPAELGSEYPITDDVADRIAQSRRQIEKILTGEDKRLLAIVGPCSVHDTEAAIDYATRLSAIQDKYKDELFIVMRTYFEKPRTVVGWKGLITDPNLDGSYALEAGLHKARKLLLDINKLGLATATEFLDMITGQYIADLITWGAIGARTTESQIHREMASALSCPVGFKNGTNGNVKIAIDAIRASKASHYFYSPDKHGRMTVYRTSGNPFGHIILRGGEKGPNFDEASVKQACDALAEFDLPQRLIVDFSHANCQKQHRKQLDVAKDICQQIKSGSTRVAGIMAESFIIEGNQPMTDINNLTYGQSITDPCLSWEDTVTMLDMLADAVKSTK
ncbi:MULTISPECIES: 3-deoxy-7-phosphoheptulonate synthase [Vibrio]|jgi:3-deoxy-7-phosphoheptulonate synthase|uniref:Phospho-2-dehydro-3-deoxyheptonate aldolase n=1 Tax=Vibrio natriegens NBRC 15636 = ATCC 14048 = DSM 759 TaxID=1219067 RepID=A0AAN0Y255_VIBNA|nr:MULTISPECIES: 3-deoxy-7-phosphoheptulonate synthase [Vibrio]MEE3877870.1 3-deoxy-7-phosphoheptulonate synthase [Vibrio sp. YYF0003]CAH0530698.1 Phospho-2-dehydro-3-deoxyheptonate aldolase, Trp-sensitive [Catenococcus thiocycli]ALR15468.1 phospho-2-dehydro-3-deoxyheptonate aldolase [Vibrio natriegens NBRC 15636 = ATCC 14048 = DSM 759]ANQ12672.1 3-deoxy-7-phosphoheptulonate synthase [Vibrio natriegens NBRC 15636 = ATCC 14048 = DSM 759]ANQ17167.1 3-deoxy-7-phosphoheptulonate synthase [Vibrio n